MKKRKMLAISASLRNARWGKGIVDLIESIKSIESKEELKQFLSSEAKIHYQQFLDAGREEGMQFDEIYRNLKKLKGKKGLCNSEVGMVAALWAAHNDGSDIEYLPLSSYFKANGSEKDLSILKDKIMSCDGLILCSPVYFGDRSSPASDLIEFIRKDDEIVASLKNKVVGGVSVGAKRNGGQETALVYQLLEMSDLGMYAVGNDSETASQYGGTIVAGDVGTAADDDYGIKTSIGVGRRVSRVSELINLSKGRSLSGKLKVMFWILQDSENFALNKVNELIAIAGNAIEVKIIKTDSSEVGRCIACDICPIHVGKDSEYRCIVKKKKDKFVDIHESIIDYDLIVPVTFSPKERGGVSTVYQKFIERTRYIRRGDYIWSNTAIFPLAYEEIGATENLQIRMITSLIRHHTIILPSQVPYLYNDRVINEDTVINNWKKAIKSSVIIAKGRLVNLSNKGALTYNPVGYILSTEVDKGLTVEQRRKILNNDRAVRLKKDIELRLK
jgi:multimeric flavodoxin WrbA